MGNTYIKNEGGWVGWCGGGGGAESWKVLCHKFRFPSTSGSRWLVYAEPQPQRNPQDVSTFGVRVRWMMLCRPMHQFVELTPPSQKKKKKINCFRSNNKSSIYLVFAVFSIVLFFGQRLIKFNDFSKDWSFKFQAYVLHRVSTSTGKMIEAFPISKY